MKNFEEFKQYIEAQIGEELCSPEYRQEEVYKRLDGSTTYSFYCSDRFISLNYNQWDGEWLYVNSSGHRGIGSSLKQAKERSFAANKVKIATSPQDIQWEFLTGDVNWEDHGGCWISQRLSNGEFWYWLVRSLDILSEEWDDAIDDYRKTYYCKLAVVAPSQFKEKDSAMRSPGIEKAWDELDEHWQVEAVFSYSGGATIHQCQGEDYQDLFDEIQVEARQSSVLFGFQMDTAQNALGSSGWDFLKGDPLAGLNKRR